jgi:hypothetical protein
VNRLLAVLTIAIAVGGCGSSREGAAPGSAPPPAATGPLPPQAPSIGRGPRFRPPSLGARAARAEPIGAMRCTTGEPGSRRFGAHLELFAARRVVLVAPGIGVAPPRRRSGAYVRGGRCSYPVRTREPTGVIEVAHGTRATLGDLFDVWGQPLSRTRMAGFTGRVRAYVGGRRVTADPRSIPLRPHAQIVLEVGGYVKPHRSYHFPPGL